MSGLATVRLFVGGRTVVRDAIWALAGVGFAGAYMPGLKALTDRLSTGEITRITFTHRVIRFGVGLSFLVLQLVADTIGWRAADAITALKPLIMISGLLDGAIWPAPAAGRLLDFASGCATALPWVTCSVTACTASSFNGMRTWLVAFGRPWPRATAKRCSPIAISVVATLPSLPASILGNEAAIRFAATARSRP